MEAGADDPWVQRETRPAVRLTDAADTLVRSSMSTILSGPPPSFPLAGAAATLKATFAPRGRAATDFQFSFI